MPKLIDSLRGLGVERVFCGGEFSMALTASGCVYGWGPARYLGISSKDPIAATPRIIRGLAGNVSNTSQINDYYL